MTSTSPSPAPRPASCLPLKVYLRIVVSSSPNLHYEHAAAAIALGKHVLVEKPMTLTTAEAMELVNAAEEHGTQFLISCPWHYTAHAIEAQRLVRNGDLGEVRMISILMTNPIGDLLRGEGTQPTHPRTQFRICIRV